MFCSSKEARNWDCVCNSGPNCYVCSTPLNTLCGTYSGRATLSHWVGLLYKGLQQAFKDALDAWDRYTQINKFAGKNWISVSIFSTKSFLKNILSVDTWESYAVVCSRDCQHCVPWWPPPACMLSLSPCHRSCQLDYREARSTAVSVWHMKWQFDWPHARFLLPYAVGTAGFIFFRPWRLSCTFVWDAHSALARVGILASPGIFISVKIRFLLTLLIGFDLLNFFVLLVGLHYQVVT